MDDTPPPQFDGRPLALFGAVFLLSVVFGRVGRPSFAVKGVYRSHRANALHGDCYSFYIVLLEQPSVCCESCSKVVYGKFLSTI